MSTPRTSRLVWIQRIYDLFLVLTAAVGVVISYTGVISPQNTYIRCDDSSIRHDYLSDTIPVSVLLVISLLGPLFTMLILEWVNLHQSQTPSPFYKGSRRAGSWFVSHLVGALFSFFVVEILKTAMSEPRPHFMNSCSPNVTEEMCQKPWIHVTQENCTNPLGLSPRKVLDSMKSFPSGHAAIGIFSAVYMTAYIQNRIRVPWSTLLVSWLQLLWWTWGLLCCTSRIWDGKHHWLDVIIGGILGGVGGYATVIHLCQGFEDLPDASEEIERLHNEDSRDSNSQATSSPKDRNGHFGKTLEMEETTKHQRLLKNGSLWKMLIGIPCRQPTVDGELPKRCE